MARIAAEYRTEVLEVDVLLLTRQRCPWVCGKMLVQIFLAAGIVGLMVLSLYRLSNSRICPSCWPLRNGTATKNLSRSRLCSQYATLIFAGGSSKWSFVPQLSSTYMTLTASNEDLEMENPWQWPYRVCSAFCL
jgi:hypothetical protein